MADTEIAIRTRVDTAGIREGLEESQRIADASPLRVGTAGTFAGEAGLARSPLAPGIVPVSPAYAARLPSESIPIVQAQAAPYLVGPPGWRGGFGGPPPVGTAAAAASPEPYGVGGGFPAGSVPLWNRPAAGTIGPAPYAVTSTLPPWAQRIDEDPTFVGSDPDLGDVEALGTAMPTPGGGGGGGRRRGGFGRGYGGLLAIHFATHVATGIARYSLRSQEIQEQLARGTDPELDRVRAELEDIQGQESIPYFGYGTQIGEAITGRLDPGGYSKLNLQGRIQDIERGRDRAEFDTGLGRERLESRMAADNLRRGAWLEGLSGTDRERGAANVSLAEAQDRAFSQRAGLVATLNTAPSGRARDEAQDRLNEFDHNRPGVAVQEIAVRDARLRAIADGEAERGWSIANRAGAGILASGGQFGAAGEEAFEAGLRQRVADAYRADPRNLSAVVSETLIERQERAARRDFRGAGLTAAAGVIDLRTAGDERGAIQAEFADARRVAEATFVGSERAGALREIGARETAGLVGAADRRASLLAGLRDRADETGLLAEGREKTAQVRGIEDAVSRATINLRGPDADEERRLITTAGINQLRTYQRELENRGLLGEGQAVPSGASIGPGFQEQRPHEEDTRQGMQELKAALDRLTDKLNSLDSFDGGGSDF